MGKKKREDPSIAVSEEIDLKAEPTPHTKRQKKETIKSVQAKKPAKSTEKPKKLNNVNKKNKNDLTKVNEISKTTGTSEISKSGKSYSAISDDSSSSSDSDSEKNSNRNDKKSLSDSNSDSDSDSSDSDSSPPSKSEKDKIGKSTETVNQTKNSVINLSPVKSYNLPPKSSSSDSYHSDTEEEDKKRRKKQKKLFKLQLNKKAKRGGTSRREMKPEPFDDLDIKEELLDDDGIDNIPSNNDEAPDWPEADYNELLRRMEAQIPPKDNQKFDSRAAKLDWTKVAFGDYSPSDCYDVWIRISKRIRRFRNLSEMIGDARDWVTKPWTNFYRGSKKNRHPDMPSRPLSTYMIYYLEHKDKVAGDNPGMEMTQVSKIISEMYKNLSVKDREKYSEMAAKERQCFEEKMNEFYKEHPEMQPQPQNKVNSREVTTKGPRKPSPPFKLFYQEQLKLYGEDGVFDRKAVEDTAKEKWKNLSDKKKLTWINWALEDSKRYEDELKVYLLEHPDYVAPGSSKSVLNKDERTIKERLSGKPIKPPNSAYSLFSRMMLQSDADVKSIPPKLRMAEISRKWKEISEAQKQRYEEKVKELQDAYKLDFASYLEGLSKEEREEELQKNQPKRKTVIKSEEKSVKKKIVKNMSDNLKSSKGKDSNNLNLYKGEPEPPPVKAYDLFLQTFLTEKPPGTSEATRLKEGPRYWDILPDAKKDFYRKKLVDLKQKYIQDYEVFLKSLSPEELKEFSVMKTKAKRYEEAQEQIERINGTLSDSVEDSEEGEKNESSSDSDSDDSDSGKSSKSSSSSEDSE